MKITTDISSDLDFLRQGSNALQESGNRLPAVAEPEAAEEDKDVLFARESIRTSMTIGLDTLRNVNELAKSTDDPKAYRVVSTLIAAISDAAETLLKTKAPAPKAADSSDLSKAAPAVNLHFEMSPREIQEKRRKGKIINPTDDEDFDTE